MNREAGKREGDEGKRPQLTDLRESGSIEQDADIVCFIHRPEYYHIGGEEMKGKAVIIIAKHRNGAVRDVNLRFRDIYASFENLGDNIVSSNYNDSSVDQMASTDVSQLPPPSFDNDPFDSPNPDEENSPF